MIVYVIFNCARLIVLRLLLLFAPSCRLRRVKCKMTTNAINSSKTDDMLTSSPQAVEAVIASRRKIKEKPVAKNVRSEIPRER